MDIEPKNCLMDVLQRYYNSMVLVLHCNFRFVVVVLICHSMNIEWL